MSQVQEITREPAPFWIVNAGGRLLHHQMVGGRALPGSGGPFPRQDSIRADRRARTPSFSPARRHRPAGKDGSPGTLSGWYTMRKEFWDRSACR